MDETFDISNISSAALGLRALALAHGRSWFVDLVDAALAGEVWAAQRLTRQTFAFLATLSEAYGPVDDELRMCAIDSTDQARPDDAMQR